MRRAFGLISSAALLCTSLAVAPAAAAQLPSPPQVVHHVARTVDNAAAHVRHDLGPHHRRVRHVRYVRHVRHGKVYYTRVVYYR